MGELGVRWRREGGSAPFSAYFHFYLHTGSCLFSTPQSPPRPRSCPRRPFLTVPPHLTPGHSHSLAYPPITRDDFSLPSPFLVFRSPSLWFTALLPCFLSDTFALLRASFVPRPSLHLPPRHRICVPHHSHSHLSFCRSPSPPHAVSACRFVAHDATNNATTIKVFEQKCHATESIDSRIRCMPHTAHLTATRQSASSPSRTARRLRVIQAVLIRRLLFLSREPDIGNGRC
ncbi:hypothetical protein B0H11DRAFT_1340911 [Mycena galericulata]|nr:hypothetical protein B0H11DRAFT_1340911 [Mycena galericulata]